jgi:hypothetical protein
MASHVRALAIIQIVYAGLGLLVAFGILLFFSGIAAVVGLNAQGDELVAVPIVAAIGWITAGVITVLAVPRLVAGIGLFKLRPWGRIVTLVVSVIGLFDFPVGTAIGIYGLWVLTHRDSEPLFVPGVQPTV